MDSVRKFLMRHSIVVQFLKYLRRRSITQQSWLTCICVLRIRYSNDNGNSNKISADADVGPRSRVCARQTLRSAPINTSGNFPGYMSAESPSNIFPNPQKSYPKFRNPRTIFDSAVGILLFLLEAHENFWNPTTFLNLPPFSPKICHSAGGRGGP